MIRILKLKGSDIQYARELIRQWIDTDAHLPSAEYLEELLNRPLAHLVVALDHNKVVGGISALEIPMFTKEINEMFIYELGVIEGYRRKGIARQLIHKVKDICQDKGIKSMFVCADADNKIAKSVYENAGGKEEAVSLFTYDE